MPQAPILVWLPWAENRVAVRESYSEGYPTGQLSITGLTWDDLQSFSDWAMSLPPEHYEPFASIHRSVELVLADRNNRQWGRDLRALRRRP